MHTVYTTISPEIKQNNFSFQVLPKDRIKIQWAQIFYQIIIQIEYKNKSTLRNWSGAVFSQSSLDGNSGTTWVFPLEIEKKLIIINK